MARRDGMAWGLRAAAVRYRFAESLFLLPSIVMASGILLAIGATSLDTALGHDADLPFLLTMTNNAALWLLATVAGAMITTVGVVFSLTVVSLQLASNHFSPRVMRSFIRDRLSQGVIGLLVGTFFYCVLVLPHLSGEDSDPAPRVSLTIAVALTLITVIGIIVHLDHLARSLQVGNVARAIAVEGEKVVAAASRAPRGLEPVEPKDHPIADDAIVVPCQSSGWVSQVSVPGLLHAVPPGTTLRLETRVGAYIHAGEPLLRVSPPVPERAHRTLAAAVEIADTRTMLQDVDFAIRQLVDIGLRALSPAIHDPTTAIEVILRLGTVLRAVLVAPLPPTGLRDGSGRVLLSPWNLEHDEYVAHAFDQLRQSSLTEPDVATALLRVLRMLRSHVQDAGQPGSVPAIERQMRLLLDAVGEAGLHPEDLRRIEAMRSDDTDPADHSH
ncbi:hypothetical protein L332_11840 [Agrococcus pavilionensis RW1]|uniref:DUF2254 domain-containing protein n=1 Tax=Agrococcus pavilionensis RW1 TaxID=1330458 RepID=U1LSP6_9MICO|nr:DUF2254 domain-containing protein [Agrococcus pavilionensis]ERG65127.1 hypothetical protein L332_11840 [Agrococcus pavilionensis RW1]